jgi:6-pyruvoyl-tetrahydropterin synthase
MYTLTIRDYLKCAHSLAGEIFGPAQLMHVITYEIDVTFVTRQLDEYGLIVDFAAAQRGLAEVLASMNFTNLDEHEDLRGKNTTTEFLCKYIHGALTRKVAAQYGGLMRVTMRESPVAWTSYEADVEKLGGKARPAKQRKGRR